MMLTIMPVTVFADGEGTTSINIVLTENDNVIEQEGLFCVTAQFTTVGSVQWTVNRTERGETTTVYNSESDQYEAVLENVTLMNEDVISAKLRNDFGDEITIFAEVAVEKTDCPNEIENELHDTEKDKHYTKYNFVDTCTDEIIHSFTLAQGTQIGSSHGAKFQDLAKKLANGNLQKSGMYYNIGATYIDEEGTEYTFKGWFLDEQGSMPATYSSSTDMSNPNNRIINTASKDACEIVTYYALYDIQEPCTNSLHDNEKNEHRHRFVAIDQSEKNFHMKWYKEYGASTNSASTTFSKRSIQGFTSGGLTHNNGIYYYEFKGWYDENDEKIDSTWNEKYKRYDFTSSVSVPASNQCEEVKIYAKWIEHCAPIVHFQYLDAVANGSGAFENTDGKIDSFSHTYTDPTVKSPVEATGYTFRGWKGTGEKEIYQASDKFTVDMSDYKDDTFTVITHSALWQPTLTVQFEDRFDTANVAAVGEKVVLTGDEEQTGDYDYQFDFDNLPKEYQLSKDGWQFLGWADENGNLMGGTYNKNVPEVFSSAAYAEYDEKDIIESVNNRYVFENVPQPEVVTFHAVWVQDGTLNVNHHYTLHTITTTYNADGTVNNVDESAETITDTKVVTTLNGKPVVVGTIDVNDDVVNELKQETYKEQAYVFEKVDQEKVEVAADHAALIDMYYEATVQKRIDLSPGTSSGGNNSGNDTWTPSDPTPTNPSIEIPDTDVPLAEPDVDVNEPDIEIEEPEVPLSDVPGEALEIDGEQVPLGDAPKTGDTAPTVAFAGLMAAAVVGLIITRRKFN